MGWFSRWSKSSDPLPPPPKQYSELGLQVLKVLDEEEHLWKLQYRRYSYTDVEGLQHSKRKLFLRVNAKGQVGVFPDNYEASMSYNSMLTNDDCKELATRTNALIEKLLKIRKQDEMAKALNNINPHPFDATCRMLASAVLVDGDKTAASALVDKCMELKMEGHL